MNAYRSVSKRVVGRNAVDGAGVRLVRVFGDRDVRDFDPFLLMDAFDSRDPDDYIRGFPWHPHRGIETITYMIEGNVEHGDSLGNEGVIRDGDCQWMTAGSGIIHQEMPKPPSRMLGAQVWLNMPARHKMAEPAYGDILAANVPCLDDGGCEVRIIGGVHQGREGAFQGRYIKPLFLDVSVPAGGFWTLDTEPEHTLFTYLFSGTGRFDPGSGETTSAKTTLLFGPGRQLRVEADAEPLRFILLSAPPLGEPIAWGGPIVMNTQQELAHAFRELDAGTFVKHP